MTLQTLARGRQKEGMMPNISLPSQRFPAGTIKSYLTVPPLSSDTDGVQGHQE